MTTTPINMKKIRSPVTKTYAQTLFFLLAQRRSAPERA